MRTLSLQEITQIDQRLESLKIQYLEIYHELRDHYFTELEKKPTEEFEVTFLQLNETFAWSVVKKMEKNLKKTSEKRIKQIQWDMLKFWKPSNPDFFIAPLTLLVANLIYVRFGITGISLTIGLISIIGILISWRALRGDLHISVRRFSAHFDKVISQNIFEKSGIFIGGLFWIYIAFNNSGFTDTTPIRLIFVSTIVTSFLLHLITLIKVAVEWEKQKTLTSHIIRR